MIRAFGAAVLLGLLPLSAPATGDPGSPPPVLDRAPDPTASAVVDRTVRDPDLQESSGLAASPSRPGILWTHNDSGNSPTLYAVDRDGAVVARVAVRGVPATDWEAIGSWRDERGRGLIAIADIGDNAAARPRIEIDVIAEPARLGTSTVTPLRRIQLRYPDGVSADAEAILIDPRTSRMYLVTKGLLRSRVFAVPAAVQPGADAGSVPAQVVSAVLEPVGAVGVQLVTDGTVLPTGHVLLRTYGSLVLLAPLDGEVRPLASVALPAQRQGESLATDGGSIYLGSEGKASQILRMAMPATFTRAMSPATPAAGPGPAGGPTPAASAAGEGSGAVGDERSLLAGLLRPSLLTFLGVGGLALGVLILLRRGRRRL